MREGRGVAPSTPRKIFTLVSAHDDEVTPSRPEGQGGGREERNGTGVQHLKRVGDLGRDFK